MTPTTPTAGPSTARQGVNGHRPPDPFGLLKVGQLLPRDQASNALDGVGRDGTPAVNGGRVPRVSTGRWTRFVDTVALAVPLLLVNGTAIYGQARWAYEKVSHDWIVAIGFAGTLECVGIFLAVEAHKALMANDSSARLRFASYLVGGVAGALNYAHYSPDFDLTAKALTFGLLSAISPWLWAIRSRSMNRERLRQLGLVDARAVKFTPLRWILHWGKTWAAFRAAVWEGETNPKAATALVQGLDGDGDAERRTEVTRAAVFAAGRLDGAGRAITRDALAKALRDSGVTISNKAAGTLAAQLAGEFTPEPSEPATA